MKNRLQEHRIVLKFAPIAILAISIPSFVSLSYASSDNPYDSGYDHGCDDARISDPDDWYINQPEKGPSFHTTEFMSGYYTGFNACGYPGNSGGNQDNTNNDNWAENGNGFKVIAEITNRHIYTGAEVRIDENRQRINLLENNIVTFQYPEGAIAVGETLDVCIFAYNAGDFTERQCHAIRNTEDKEPEHVYFNLQS